MLAHHPTTGQPIRILRTSTQIASSDKTLIWIRPEFVPSHRWSRYYTVLNDPAAYTVCQEYTAIIVSEITDAWMETLPKICHSTSETLIVAPMNIIKELERRGFHWTHTFLYEELYDGYPYLGEPLNAIDLIEKVIISIAHILRIKNIWWTSSIVRDELPFSVRAQYDAWTHSCMGQLRLLSPTSDDSVIPQIYLIQQYFKHSSNRRTRELNTCLEKNIECSYIDKIILLNEQEYSDLPISPKLTYHIIGHRLTFYDVFTSIQAYVPTGSYVVIANSDIFCTPSLSHLYRIPMNELFLSLLRWEYNPNGTSSIFGPRADSQDVWIIARDSVTFTPTIEELGFPFGKSGCDNAIALIMMKKKLLVVNPAYSIQCMHVHATNIRDYDPKDVLYRTHYLYIEPTAIQTSTIRKNLQDINSASTELTKSWQGAMTSFSRRIHAVEDGTLRTFCSMLKHTEDTHYLYNTANLYTPSPSITPLYNFKIPLFVTLSGLISGFYDIFVGPHTQWAQQWEVATQSMLTQCIHVPHLISIPASSKCLHSLSYWALHYLPRALQIRELLQDSTIPDFLVPQISEIGSFLNDCLWKDAKQITVVPMMDDMNYYSDDVWVMPPDDTTELVTVEDIDRLRSLLPAVPIRTTPVAVFCVEDDETAVCTRGWAEEISDVLLSKGWTARYVASTDTPSNRRKAFSDASWIIGSGSSLEWIWYAPKGSTVMEFMSDSAPRSDICHLAGACGLRYIVGLTKQEPLPFRRQAALIEVGRAIKKFGFRELLEIARISSSDKPRIIIPSGFHGLHSHTEDTFREMALLWGELGYINVERSTDTPFVWWGGIGEILLYDRPTLRWWVDVPPYQMAMFGNCALPGPAFLRQSIWSFWPRSPRTVETIVAKHMNQRGFDSRSIASIFLGKVENGVQMAHRTTVDWSKSVEMFSMPVDSTGKPYPYSQTEYLGLLCKSRFGLCLPGFGAKCNREIEYFACGVVPIVTSGIDIKQYLVPPIEGVHYLVAKTPADVSKLIASINAEKWAAMSYAGREWWHSYASAEGLFRLTWARIEQCRPYFNVGIPQKFTFA